MENWLIFSFKRKVEPYTFPDLHISELMSGNNFEIEEGKIYVLDLWTTSCKNCIEDFPKFNELSNEFSDNKDIQFMTLNMPLSKDTDFNKVIKYTADFDFGKLIAEDKKVTEKAFGINTYPNYVIVNDKKEVVYIGWLNNKWYDFYNNVYYLLRRLM
jgi:thiol-disulfide isomerase/thioredoxin